MGGRANDRVVKPKHWGISYSAYFITIIVFLGLAVLTAFLLNHLIQEKNDYANQIKTLNRNLEQLLALDDHDPETPGITVHITLPQPTAQTPETLTDALSVMQSQYDSNMSNITLFLTVFAIIMTLFALGIPVLNYTFLQKDQVHILRGTEENMQRAFAHTIQAVDMEMQKMNAAIESVYAQEKIIADTFNQKTSQIDEELSRINNAVIESQKVSAKTADPKQTIELKPISEKPEDIARNYYMKSLYEDDSDKKLELLSMAIEANPEYCDAYFRRGNVYIDKREYEKAVADYDVYIQSKPEDDDAFNNRGIAYKYLKQYDNALKDFNKAIAINPDNSIPYYNRGSLYSIIREYDKAIIEFDTTISLDPKHVGAYNNRGMAYAQMEQYNKAFDDISTALSIKPDSPHVLDSMGDLLTKTGKPAEALDYFNKAISINGTLATLYYNRAVCHTRLGDDTAALADCQTALSLDTCDTTLQEQVLQQMQKLNDSLKIN